MRGKLTDKRVRARAVGLAMVVGANEASRQTGIPERSVRRWVMDPEMAELAARTKETVAEEWWAIVQKGFRRVEALLDSTEDAQKAATATAIIFDKMALSRGEPTSRTETRTWTDDLDDHEKARLRDWIDSLDDTATVAGPGETPAAS
jgi:hypothetical protein